MGKEMKITCDCCGNSLNNINYFVLTIHKVRSGKKTRQPTIYVCPKCFRETKLALLISDLQSEVKNEQS